MLPTDLENVMNGKSWLPLLAAAAATAWCAACSPEFTACEACASAGAGSVAGGSGGKRSIGGADSQDDRERPKLFEPCSQLGLTACLGPATAQRLTCDGSRWLTGTTCAAGARCDSGSGECVHVVPECAEA